MRNLFIKSVIKAAEENDSFSFLENKWKNLTKKQLSQNLIQFGIMPEVFAHDSSEEKSWAKLSDIILASALNHLGIKAEVLRTRGNSADVFGKNENYTIVGDAKTFRLSRTAKNQKDFKIKALDDWRKENTYAVLVSPLSQYPSRSSQIYSQAVERNVTLLSYLHLKLLLDKCSSKVSLKGLWELGKNLNKAIPKNQHSDSAAYWEHINQYVAKAANVGLKEIEKYKSEEISITRHLGNEGILYWKNKILEYKKLSREEAVKKLLKAEKIESKIKTITKAINSETAI